MDITIAVLKDAGELVKATSEAVKQLLEAITSAVTSGARGFDDLTVRRERKNLVRLSAALTRLGSHSNVRVVRSLDEYLSVQQPSEHDWQSVVESFDYALVEIQEVIDRLERQRGGFVLHDAYVDLSEGLHARIAVLEKLRAIHPPPIEPEERAELAAINGEYKRLIRRLRKAVRAMNSYVGEEFYNQLEDEELAQHIP